MSSIIEASAALRKRKHLKRGINFTIMVVGQSGSGRSTFINTLCGQQVVDTSTSVLRPNDNSTAIDLQLRHEMVELEDDDGVKIQLNIIDTPGFGDSLDNSSNFDIIKDYICHQYDEILLEESRVRRNPRFKDGRIHCCLYFIQPSGHGLKEIDVEFMKQMGPLVNIIPVICKADSLTVEELKFNKKLIMDDINYYALPIYNFPFEEDDISDEDYQTNTYLRSLLPFSVIGSNDVYELDNKTIIRGRKYPWGMLDVEDPNISDFVILRNTLLISHLNDLKEYTHEILYERYRTETLSGGNSNGNHRNPSTSDNKLHNDDASVTNVEDIKTLGNNTSKSVGIEGESATRKTSNGKNETYLAREEQIKLEEERLKAFEERVQQELKLKRKELLQREQELREIEERLENESSVKQDH
ncbi:probable Cell division control protein 11 [Saccharomycodes ludwigii]|uniref:Probable Cell division control protein 11 n=1 Tax=Saccharomycodes ludwigii TaxID=36035 RepID=A0A376B509_9ASCO|nr:hypothetical protein SCDLUD_002230 [Saccharomycodes ludwigii]KAH3902408.1 hypothetical protein SCDLUD_002230 [Saccharomycodes ludwigii]SSD59669.1 probable Cell division control protein 11 [Saccharomycodes ludwigii]